MDTETFVTLPAELSNYAITKSGKVLCLLNNVEVIPTIGENSLYIGVTITPIGSYRSVTMHLHRLLAIAFISNNTGLPINQLHVNHINGAKLDNSLENLEWATRSRNCQHAYDTGLRNDNLLIEVVDPFNFYEHIFFCSQAAAARFLKTTPPNLHYHMNNPNACTFPIKGYYVSYCDERSLGFCTDSEIL